MSLPKFQCVVLLVSALSVIMPLSVPCLDAASSATDYCNYGDTLYSKSDYANAMKYYVHAAKLDKGMWQAYKGIAACYNQQEDYEKALRYAKHALKLNPGEGETEALKVEIEAKLGIDTAVAPDGGVSDVSGEEMGGSDDSFKKLVYGFRLGGSGSLVGVELDGSLSSAATTSASIGAGAGIAAIVRYRLSDKLSLQVEPGFAKKAWVGAYTLTDPLFSLYEYYSYFAVIANYLELPILFGASPSAGGFRPVFLIGPYLGFKIGSSTAADIKITDSSGVTTIVPTATSSEGLAAMDMGLLVGLSLEFGRFILDGRYGKGFTSVYDSDVMSGKATSYHGGIGWIF